MTDFMEAFNELLRSLGRRRRQVRVLNRFLTWEFYALLISTPLFLAARLAGTGALEPAAVFLPTTVTAVAFLWEFFRRRPDPLELLWDADTAHNGGHLLPAAYNAMRVEAESGSRELTTALLRRGATMLPRVRVEITYPWRIPVHGYLMPLAVLGLILVHLFTVPAAAPTEPNPWLGYAEELRERAEAMAEAAAREEDRRGAALARELTALAEMLESRPTEKETQERIAQLLPELQEGMRRLGATDLITDPRDPTEGAVGEAQEEGTLRAGRQEEGGTPLLPDGLDSRGEGGAGGGEPGERRGDEPLEESDDPLQQLKEALLEEGTPREAPEGAPPSGEERRRDGNAAGPGGVTAEPGEEREREESDSGGRGAGEEPAPDLGEPEPPEIAGAVERLLQLPRGEGRGGEFSELFAREAPGVPESSLSPEELLPVYRRQVEAAVERSEIPREYRGIVRDYFLRIGEQRYEQ